MHNRIGKWPPISTRVEQWKKLAPSHSLGVFWDSSKVCAFEGKERERKEKTKGKLASTPCLMKIPPVKHSEKCPTLWIFHIKKRGGSLCLGLKLRGILLLCIGIRPLPTLLFKSRCKNLPLICLALFIYLFIFSFMVSNLWRFFWGSKFQFFFWVLGGHQVASIHQTKSLMPFDLLMFRSSMMFNSCFKLGKSSRCAAIPKWGAELGCDLCLRSLYLFWVCPPP